MDGSKRSGYVFRSDSSRLSEKHTSPSPTEGLERLSFSVEGKSRVSWVPFHEGPVPVFHVELYEGEGVSTNA